MNQSFCIVGGVLAVAYAMAQTPAVQLRDSANTVVLEGKFKKMQIRSLSVTVSDRDSKGTAHLDATILTENAQGQVKGCEWGDNPETKVLDSAGLPTTLKELKEGTPVKLIGIIHGTLCTTQEIRILDGGEAKPAKAEGKSSAEASLPEWHRSLVQKNATEDKGSSSVIEVSASDSWDLDRVKPMSNATIEREIREAINSDDKEHQRYLVAVKRGEKEDTYFCFPLAGVQNVSGATIRVAEGTFGVVATSTGKVGNTYNRMVTAFLNQDGPYFKGGIEGGGEINGMSAVTSGATIHAAWVRIARVKNR